MPCCPGGYPQLEIHALGQYAPNPDCVGPSSTLALEWIHAALPGDEKTQGLYTLEVQVCQRMCLSTHDMHLLGVRLVLLCC